MTVRPRRPARPVLLAASMALATVIAGCVASPGASAPSSQGIPSGAPTESPSAPSPTPSPSAPPSPSGSPSSSAGACGVATWSKGANDLVLRLTVAGGFVPPGVDLTNMPVISIYGDGRVISPGAQIMIYPGPLLPALQVQHLSDAGMRKVLDAAAEAGLLVKDVTYESHGIADAPTYFFTLTADGCTHHVNAYALTESDMTTGLDQATIDARARLRDFQDKLAGLSSFVGKENLTDGGLYEATSYRIVTREETAANGGASPSGLPQGSIAWPLKTPLASFGEPLAPGMADMRCGVADGTDATALTPLFQKANAETRWTSAGRQFYLRVRPLLPDESGCRDDLVYPSPSS